ncbi:MAG: hypothetical protein IPM77_12850 [Crocinitomicaceae bacterium]|nr:hypothetical protein [Crocinitomicaceae bacterium]
MIQLNLQYEDENLTYPIVQKLSQEKLVLEMVELKEIHTLCLEHDQVVKRKCVQLTAITKSLLFNKIMEELRTLDPDQKIKVFALPVVQSGFNQTQDLFDRLLKV